MLEQESPNIAPTPTLSQPGLLVMDVDSTLIDEEVIDRAGRRRWNWQADRVDYRTCDEWRT